MSGYYGFGNLGDEAVLAGLLAELRARAPRARLVVLSADPPATEALHRVEAVGRAPVAVWQAVRGARLVVCGGGSLVQDATSARSAVYYLGVMMAAARRGVPVAVVGQGVGPLRRPWVRRLAARAFAGVRVLSVRDAASARALRQLGVTSEIHLGADLAALTPRPDPQRVRRILAAEGLDRANARVGVAVRAWPGMRSPAEIGRGIRRVAETYGARVAVFPFDLARDREISEEVAAAAAGRVVPVPDPRDLLGVVGAMDVMVAVRLHGLIFAALGGVPAVAVAYDPKVSAFAAEVGLPGVVPVDATGLAIAEALGRTFEGRVVLRSRLQQAAPGLRARASTAVGLVAAVLSERDGARAARAGVPPNWTE
ncbi:MAG: polysaccharide pyruvyl transferase CsaB [Armatimonadota bacterium]|nr:polysaccharide pyruvyl transferase CsaB [Armatimonadota bacterium]MDR7420864.1 polysaccharide pyruvyl transferase CsaB [Armatimonadota bacterium]MDR7456621.1 polysaccharide pyruvyl transferase CsaB [Armatimonadota bacterium]